MLFRYPAGVTIRRVTHANVITQPAVRFKLSGENIYHPAQVLAVGSGERENNWLTRLWTEYGIRPYRVLNDYDRQKFDPGIPVEALNNGWIERTHPNPVYRLQAMKDLTWSQVKDKRLEIMEGGIVHNTNTYQTRQIDRDNVRSILDAYASTSLTGTTSYVTKDNTVVSLAVTDFQSMHDKGVNLFLAADARAQALRALINAANNQTTLEGVPINTGWPTVPYNPV